MTPRKPTPSRATRSSATKRTATTPRRAPSSRTTASRKTASRTASSRSKNTGSRRSDSRRSSSRAPKRSSFLASRLAPQVAHTARVWRSGSARRRFQWFVGVAVVMLTILVGWSVKVQVVSGSGYRAYGVSQRESNITIPAARGTIFDRDGNEMAITVPAFSLYADPRAVLDPAATAHVLGQMLGFDTAAES